jgi:hypothetical protein
MEIERNGQTVATVNKALVSPLRDRFTIDVEDGEAAPCPAGASAVTR